MIEDAFGKEKTVQQSLAEVMNEEPIESAKEEGCELRKYSI